MDDLSIPGYEYDDRPYSTDSGSGASVLDYLKFGGSTATGLLGALKSSRAATAAPTVGQTNWGLIAGIGAAVVLVLVLVMSLGGRR
jgi:hypothetical protein